jgi:Holliday junction resolvasome RuvABC endonuclease subunit
MAVLALDLGWQFGWCIWRRGDAMSSGVVNLRAQAPTDGARLRIKRQWLTSKLAELTAAGEILADVVYERITFVGKNGVDTLHAHGKQLGAVESWCALKGVPEPDGINWDDVKKHVTGQRSAARELVLKTIQRQFPNVTDHNEASAIAVMLTARHRAGVS